LVSGYRNFKQERLRFWDEAIVVSVHQKIIDNPSVEDVFQWGQEQLHEQFDQLQESTKEYLLFDHSSYLTMTHEMDTRFLQDVYIPRENDALIIRLVAYRDQKEVSINVFRHVVASINYE